MKVVILAGGFGTRLSDETLIRPKPMVKIGNKPILWHIMKIYSSQGFNEFVILLGYKGYQIKDYFMNYSLHNSNLTIDLASQSHTFHSKNNEDWKVTLVDTGRDTMTGSRIKLARDFIGDSRFMLTYGDGLANIDLNKLLKTHKSHDGILTMTSVRPEGRFGIVTSNENNEIETFQEKPKGDGQWINAGFFVCEPDVYDYIIDEKTTIFEKEPLINMVKDKVAYTYRHYDFW